MFMTSPSSNTTKTHPTRVSVDLSEDSRSSTPSSQGFAHHGRPLPTSALFENDDAASMHMHVREIAGAFPPPPSVYSLGPAAQSSSESLAYVGTNRSSASANSLSRSSSAAAASSLPSSRERFVYYRVYEDDDLRVLQTSFDPNDDTLGRTSSRRVAPPHTVAAIKRHIARIENMASPAELDLFADLGSAEPLPDDHRLALLATGGPGSSPEEPLAFVVSPSRSGGGGGSSEPPSEKRISDPQASIGALFVSGPLPSPPPSLSSPSTVSRSLPDSPQASFYPASSSNHSLRAPTPSQSADSGSIYSHVSSRSDPSEWKHNRDTFSDIAPFSFLRRSRRRSFNVPSMPETIPEIVIPSATPSPPNHADAIVTTAGSPSLRPEAISRPYDRIVTSAPSATSSSSSQHAPSIHSSRSRADTTTSSSVPVLRPPGWATAKVKSGFPVYFKSSLTEYASTTLPDMLPAGTLLFVGPGEYDHRGSTWKEAINPKQGERGFIEWKISYRKQCKIIEKPS